MDENKKSLLIHYITEFILGSIGIGIFVILLYFNEFDLNLARKLLPPCEYPPLSFDLRLNLLGFL